MTSATLWPDKIRMSGLPFGLHGWNTIFTKTDEIFDDCPVYELKSYTLYGMIGIIGAKIMRFSGAWIFQRQGDEGFPLFFLRKLRPYQTPDATPFGTWTYKSQVTDASTDRSLGTFLLDLFGLE